MKTFFDLAEQTYGIVLNADQREQFEIYERLLLEWNAKINLTAIRDEEGIRLKHFLDSLSCVLVIDKAPKSLIDIGTGAGFPGLVLKILYPDMKLTLVDSVGKKARFCELAAKELGFDGVLALSSRAEDLGQDPAHRQKYEWVTARAVARLPILLEYLLPLAKVGGTVIAQKGETAAEELKDAANALKVLGGKFDRAIPVQLPGLEDERSLLVFSKVSPTPKTYPRNPGIPSKKPL